MEELVGNAEHRQTTLKSEASKGATHDLAGFREFDLVQARLSERYGHWRALSSAGKLSEWRNGRERIGRSTEAEFSLDTVSQWMRFVQ